jgi:hypothetical protein
MRDPWRLVLGGGNQTESGESLEDQPAGGFGRSADVEPVEHDRGCDGRAYLPFDQAEDEQCQAEHSDQGGDASVVLQKHRRHRQGLLMVLWWRSTTQKQHATNLAWQIGSVRKRRRLNAITH